MLWQTGGRRTEGGGSERVRGACYCIHVQLIDACRFIGFGPGGIDVECGVWGVVVPRSGACGAVAITSLLHFAFDDVVSQAASQAARATAWPCGCKCAVRATRRDETTAQWAKMGRVASAICVKKLNATSNILTNYTIDD